MSCRRFLDAPSLKLTVTSVFYTGPKTTTTCKTVGPRGPTQRSSQCLFMGQDCVPTKAVEKSCDETSLQVPLKIFHVLGVTITLLTYRANVSQSVSLGTKWQALPHTRFQLSKYISLCRKTCLFKYSQIFETLRFGLPFCTGTCKGMLDRIYQY